MSVTYKDKWELNIQHSLHAYLSPLLSADFNNTVTIVAEWPEDKKILMPDEYAAMNDATNYTRLPAISIQVRNTRPGRMVELGGSGQENNCLIQVSIQAINQAQRQVLSRYIANRLRLKSLPIYNYEKYPDANAASVGNLEIHSDPSVAENNSLSNENPALRYGGVVTTIGTFINS